MASWGLFAGWVETMIETQIKDMTGMNPPEVVCHNAFLCWREAMGGEGANERASRFSST